MVLWHTRRIDNMAKQKFTTTIDAELLEKIKIQAIKEKRSVSDLLEELIKKYLKEDKGN